MEKWKHLKIPLEDIKEATNNFQDKIGRGGYGCVYKGQLSLKGKHTMVAVKRLDAQFGQGLKEFLTEIDLLSGQHHQNIITLVGYCDEVNEKIIVYEYAERGSLDRYITRSNSLGWLQRLRIVVDAARALDHLHNHLRNKQVIIHRDIKSSNILLDHNWVAKISDLGLSKSTFSGLGASLVISHACGTPGFVEPEYWMTGLVTKQSDVYSFGMVLFEVLCSKLCTVTDKDGGFMFDAQTVKDLYTNNKLDEIIDRDLRKQMNMTALRKFSAIAYRCLLDRKDRPLMDVVKNELEETLKIEGEVSKKKLDAETSKSLPGAHRFSLAEINHATDEFAPKNKLTQGGFGGAFRGNISGKEVVVWRMTKEKGPRIQTFYDLLSVCNHVNFISLGYCDEEEEKILVYEQMTHGASLYDCLFRHTNFIPRLSVEQRLEICIGVAKGLSHLHSLTNTIILKPHVKTANVYLDRNLVPKITSFNSFNFDVRPSESSWSLERVYLAPERFIPNYPYSPKVDVYAFGVVLLEVLLEKSLMILPAFIMPGQLHMFVKLNIYGECIRECESVIRLCLEHDPARRPFMNEVVDRLEHALQLQKQWIGGT